jgi:hypothetical protein
MKPALELFLELQERIITLEKRLAALEGNGTAETVAKKSPGRPRKDEVVNAQ